MARAPKQPDPGRRKKAGRDKAAADPAPRARSPFPAPPRPQPPRTTAERSPALRSAPSAPVPRRRAPDPTAESGRKRTASLPGRAPAAPRPVEKPALVSASASASASIPASAGGGATGRIVRGLRLLVELARVNLSGWSGILRAGFRGGLTVLVRVNLVQLLFAGACAAVLTTALARWLQYDITLLSLETVESGSRSRFWFLAPALLGFLFVAVEAPFRRVVFYISAAAAGALYAAGFVFPDPIHTKMLKYEFTPWIYAYGAALAAAASLAGGGLSRALLEKEALRNFLFNRPAD